MITIRAYRCPVSTTDNTHFEHVHIFTFHYIIITVHEHFSLLFNVYINTIMVNPVANMIYKII